MSGHERHVAPATKPRCCSTPRHGRPARHGPARRSGGAARGWPRPVLRVARQRPRPEPGGTSCCSTTASRCSRAGARTKPSRASSRARSRICCEPAGRTRPARRAAEAATNSGSSRGDLTRKGEGPSPRIAQGRSSGQLREVFRLDLKRLLFGAFSDVTIGNSRLPGGPRSSRRASSGKVTLRP